MAKRKRQIDTLVGEAGAFPEGTGASPDLEGCRIMKARRGGQQRARETDLNDFDSDSDSSDDDNYRTTRRVRELSHVKSGQLAYPRSAYEGYTPQQPIVSEREALDDFTSILQKARAESAEPSEYDFVILEDFSIYRTSGDARRPNELAGLEKLQIPSGTTGGLSLMELFVQGYGDPEITDLSDRICIQSPLTKRQDVWYQLGRPSQEYRRFYGPFLWLAEFTKHFVDYLLEMESVTLDDFRFCFYDWLDARYKGQHHFQLWIQNCGLRDFRTTISAHVAYLWNECCGLADGEPDLCKHPLWCEVAPWNLQAIPEQPNLEEMTVVTPFVYDMFKHMYFSKHIASREVTSTMVSKRIRKMKAELGLSPFGPSQTHNIALLTPKSQRSLSPAEAAKVTPGDVVCLDADPNGNWKTRSNTWYAYVQDVRENEEGLATRLEVLWMYEHQDTTLGSAFYPFKNELFLSDNCECGKDAIDIGHVKGKVHVSWFATDPNVQSGLFVRQKFRTAHDEGTNDFVTLQTSDFKCRCGIKRSDFEDCRLEYEIGDTVLVKTAASKMHGIRLDPALIVDFDLGAQKVVLAQLQRVSEIDEDARPNELRMTNVTYARSPKHVIRKCHVRVFSQDIIAGGLPTGYDRGGAGDFFYVKEGDLDRPTTTEAVLEPAMAEGLDLVVPPEFERLTGLGMFCGGGNFDRGLEESGAVDFRYGVDWAKRAMHTYRANSKEPDKTHCFLGSVNDYLALAVKGSNMSSIAAPGKIDLISAGSPCPGFSSLQRDKSSDTSLRNASMVASVVSFVDVYCPKYCILENVVSMTSGMGDDRNQYVFAQVIASFVAMGYQVQQFLMDAWSHGSSQSRSRVFIVASAPGLEPFKPPQLTHDHPQTEVRFKALGKSSNGRSFGLRRNEYTPFETVSAASATADLPDIGDGQSRICPSHPDHMMPSEEDAVGRERIASVPTRPAGMTLANAVQRDSLVVGEPAEYIRRRKEQRREKKLVERSYGRVYPSLLFPIVTTHLKLECRFTGRSLHWEQNRSLTVMELRRAMGFPDHEVIIGSPRQQVEIIGNSVDRAVSFALGLCLRESWAHSSARRELEGPAIAALASPLATEEESEQAEDLHDGAYHTAWNMMEERARRPHSHDNSAPNDALRAGAAGAANLENLERNILQHQGEVETGLPHQATPRLAPPGVIHLSAGMTGDEEAEASERVMCLGRDEEERLAGRPTAYVEVVITPGSPVQR